MYRKQGSDPKRICFYLNGEQAPLQAIIKIHMFWILTKLSLLLIWNLLGYLNSFSLIANTIAAPSRRHSSEDTKFIRSEVQRLLDADIVEPARSPWRAQVLVVKQGEKKRLVIDYSVTINRFTLLDAYPLPNIEDLVNRIARDKYLALLTFDWRITKCPC